MPLDYDAATWEAPVIIGGTPVTPEEMQRIDNGVKAVSDAVDALTAGSGIPASTVDAKGDLIVGTADNTVGRLPVGTNGQIPYADSSQATGIRWDDAPSGGGGGGAVDSVNAQTGVVVLNQDNIGDGATFKQYSATEKTKLAGVATGATANSTDATLLARANHTGTQSADTIVDGSTNHVFTAADDTKLGGIAAGATANDTDANLKNRSNHTGTQSASTVNDFDAAARLAVRRDTIFSYGPTLIVGSGTHRIYNRSGVTRTIALVSASVGTQPTGAAVIVDVHKNGTTIFTTQANRPTIAVSSNEDVSGAPDVTSWADGDFLTIDIDQIGSTIAGAALTVVVVWS